MLSELSEEYSATRLGQLVTNLATLAKGPTVEAIWDAEDEALLEAAQRQLKLFRTRHSSAA